ncbi:MAG: prephenate dehydratase domain-containing protein, partial [Bacteroidota bacterium]
VGAIASTLAAELYEMKILAESIETNKVNYTRFLVLENEENSPPLKKQEKISISFSVQHKVGSLHKVLEALANRRANLTKIQSVPLLGSQGEYLFFVDFVLEHAEDYDKTIVALLPLASNLNVLGKYKIGQYHDY